MQHVVSNDVATATRALILLVFYLKKAAEQTEELTSVNVVGQAFSQTFSSVALSAQAIKIIPDVERNGRVFSDGVGTCSTSVLQAIHEAYGQSRALKPTLLQIRLQGKT